MALYGDIVAKAPADGYTLLLSGSGLWILPLMQANLPYDPVRDFSPITFVDMSPTILVVHSSVPVMSVKELVALANARPGQINYASGPAGSINHLAPELFKFMTGTKLVRIVYKGGAPALSAVLSGEVQLTFAPAGGVAPYLKSASLRALAVTSLKPSVVAPGLPTMAAAGLPGFEAVSPDVILAPAKTPAIVINRLSHEIVQVLNMHDVKEKFFNAGTEIVGSSPDGLEAFIKSDMDTWGQVIKAAGIRAD